MKNKNSRARSAGLLILINTVILLVILLLAEVLLSHDDVPAEVRYSVFPPNMSTTVKVDPVVTIGVQGDAEFSVNAQGTRGPLLSSEDDIRIVAIGGSTTECFVLSLEESWPHRLGVHLEERIGQKVWVGNLGRAGRNSRQHFFDAKYVVPQFGRIDFAVLLVGINDQFNRMIQGQGFDSVDVLELDGAGEYINTALHLSEIQTNWFERLHLVNRAKQLLETLTLLTPEQREVQRLLSHTLPGYYLNSRAMRAARGVTLDQMPAMDSAIGEFQRNLKLIITELRKSGVEPVLVSQPAMWNERIDERESSQLWLGSADGWPPNQQGGPYYSVRVMQVMLRLYNETIQSVATSEKVLFIDLAALLPQNLTTLYDDIHFNERGSANVALAITDALIQSGFPGSPRLD